MMILSSIVFILLYVYPTHQTWKKKCNPRFPSPSLIRKEIIHTVKGLTIATLVPSFTLYASAPSRAYSQGYCGNPYNLSISGWLLQTLCIFAFSDLVEYIYHYCGHRYDFWWSIHKHHHHFYNPSPFAVIADDWPDQFMRTLPMIILPSLLPINMDLLFFCFASLFYGYGVYLHSGYESTALSAHNPIFNTSYHHYHHHALSTKNKPICTGFFFKVWDQLFNTEDDKKKCTCLQCRPAKDRSLAAWKKTIKPDYSVLLSITWWWNTSIDVSE